jgi:catechol 2,3-dioxygenase-like lactoylglutathione lyase family enzyme
VAINTMTLEDLGDGRTKLVTISLFHTPEERDGMLHSGMEQGLNQSYQALDRVLAAAGEGDHARTQPSARGQEQDAQADGLAVRKVAFTMYPVSDVARARKFYEQTLGLRVGMHGGQGGMFWVEYDLPGGGCLALTNTTGDEPSAKAGGTLALEVENLAALMQHLKRHDVTFRSEVIRGPHCQMAVCLDSEGNSLLLHQRDRC